MTPNPASPCLNPNCPTKTSKLVLYRAADKTYYGKTEWTANVEDAIEFASATSVLGFVTSRGWKADDWQLQIIEIEAGGITPIAVV